jgi:4-amino-4-deoxy-L-arabinose transferase-like glycosyltransferase
MSTSAVSVAPARHRRHALIYMAAALIVTTFVVRVAHTAFVHAPNTDEAWQLAAGLHNLQTGAFDVGMVNPPLVRLWAASWARLLGAKPQWADLDFPPVARPEIGFGQNFIERTWDHGIWWFIAARWVSIPWSLVGAFAAFCWARELYGNASGLLALFLWCFCPNILTHSATLTTDVAATSFSLAAGYSFWRWLKHAQWTRASTAGGLLGMALISKNTCLVLIPLWMLLAIIEIRRGYRARRSRLCLRRVGQLAVILGLAWLAVTGIYGFEGFGKELREYRFVSQTLSGSKRDEPPETRTENRFRGTWAARLPVPLPENYVLGIDMQKHDFERTWTSYLRGTMRYEGWWYYYLYGLAVKVPLGTWVAAALCLLARCLLPWRRSALFRDLILLLPAACVIVLVSSQTAMNVHFRYVLPAFGFGFVWLSQLAAILEPRRWILRVLAAGALAWSAVSGLAVHPHYVGYFSEIVGGPKEGHWHMLGSSLDEGQDFLFLRAWIRDHPEVKLDGLVFYSFVIEPWKLGLKIPTPPWGPPKDRSAIASWERYGPLPGWYAVSATYVHHPGQPWYYFLHFEPEETVGCSIFIYHIDLVEANQVRATLGLQPVTDQEADP